MKKKVNFEGTFNNVLISSEVVHIMCDDKCCGHCTYYQGNGYCVDKKPVRPTDWCSDFKWPKY